MEGSGRPRPGEEGRKETSDSRLLPPSLLGAFASSSGASDARESVYIVCFSADDEPVGSDPPTEDCLCEPEEDERGAAPFWTYRSWLASIHGVGRVDCLKSDSRFFAPPGTTTAKGS